MAKPNFSGVYTLKSSENEDAFLKAQGVSWVLRKAAKAVGSKRVLIEHSGDNLKIKAGLVDLEYVIGGAPLPTSCMGFECTDACAWQSDGEQVTTVPRHLQVYTHATGVPRPSAHNAARSPDPRKLLARPLQSKPRGLGRRLTCNGATVG